MNIFSTLRHRIFQPTLFPFVLFTQKRWRKPTVSAQTRLEDRVRDPHLDKLMTHLNKLDLVLGIHKLMTNRKRGPFVSLQLMSRWRNILGLNVPIASFLRKYPHVFEVFLHPLRRNPCCRITRRMKDLILLEGVAAKQQELEAVKRVKKLLMMSVNGTLRVHALRMIRRELGLPEDFRDSILSQYCGDFRLVDLEVVELVGWDDELGVAHVEKWREKEYTEKWLSEFETKFAFPINFPTGFKIERGFRDKLKNWQRLPYTKPYERKEIIRVRTCGGFERYEKRAVAVLHELLSLTVDKMVDIDQLAHFRRDLAIKVNVRELLLSFSIYWIINLFLIFRPQLIVQLQGLDERNFIGGHWTNHSLVLKLLTYVNKMLSTNTSSLINKLLLLHVTCVKLVLSCVTPAPILLVRSIIFSSTFSFYLLIQISNFHM